MGTNANVTSGISGTLLNHTASLANRLVSTSSGLADNSSEIPATARTTETWNITEPGRLGVEGEQWSWVATVVLVIATVLVNGAVLGVTWKTATLHSTLYALLASMAVAHTLSALLVMPMAINAAIYGNDFLLIFGVFCWSADSSEQGVVAKSRPREFLITQSRIKRA